MNKTILLTAMVFGATAFLPVASAFASGITATPTPTTATNCQPIYGGGTTCETTELIIDKTVKNPATGVFVDNIGVNDPKYAPGSVVNFKVKVVNTSNVTFNKVTVTDTLPDYISFTEGNAKTHTFVLDNLKPNEQRVIDVSAKVVSATALPNDQGITCIINTAKAVSGNKSATDTAQFCVEKKVLGVTPVPTTTKGGLPVYPTPNVTKTPPTGPEALALVGLVPSSLLGFILRKKASR